MLQKVPLIIGVACVLFSFCLLNIVLTPDEQSASAISTIQDTANTTESNEQANITSDTAAPTNYLVYKDPISGIKLEYPLNWLKIEGGNYIEFEPPQSQNYSSSSSFSTKSLPSTLSKTLNKPSNLTAFEIRIDGNLPFDVANSLDKYTRLKIIPQKQIGEF